MFKQGKRWKRHLFHFLGRVWKGSAVYGNGSWPQVKEKVTLTLLLRWLAGEDTPGIE
jgi:hypothetical protein